MRYFKVEYSAGYCGTEEEQYIATKMTDEELYEYFNEIILDHAMSYSYLLFGWGVSSEEYARENDLTIEEVEQTEQDYYDDALSSFALTSITKEEWEENNGEEI